MSSRGFTKDELPGASHYLPRGGLNSNLVAILSSSTVSLVPSRAMGLTATPALGSLKMHFQPFPPSENGSVTERSFRHSLLGLLPVSFMSSRATCLTAIPAIGSLKTCFQAPPIIRREVSGRGTWTAPSTPPPASRQPKVIKGASRHPM